VRPLPGQRSALFKNAPGVFVPGVGRFTLQVNLFFPQAFLLLFEKRLESDINVEKGLLE